MRYSLIAEVNCTRVRIRSTIDRLNALLTRVDGGLRHGQALVIAPLDGARVAKHDLRVEAFGTVDEANAAIGLVAARYQPGALKVPPAVDGPPAGWLAMFVAGVIIRRGGLMRTL